MHVETELVDGARSGGADLERLVRAVWPEAYRIAFSMLRDRGLAEDAAQEACAAIARSLPSLKKTAGFAAWSYKIVVNHAIVLHYYAGLNSREIAESTGISAPTVRFHLMLARRTLLKALSAVPEPNAQSSEEVLSNVR